MISHDTMVTLRGRKQGSARAGFRDPKPGEFQNEPRNPDFKILNPARKNFLTRNPARNPDFRAGSKKPTRLGKFLDYFYSQLFDMLHIQRAEKC